MSYSITNPIYPRPTVTSANTYLTSQVVTVTSGSTTVTAFNLVSPGAVDLVSFDVFGDDIRVYWEGSTPTSTTGHVLPGGTAYTWSAVQFNASKFILSSGSTSSVITASPFTAG